MHRSVELTAPAEKAVLDDVENSGPFDLVVANDARALPIAFAAANSAPILADMHEWAAEEQAILFAWRLLVGPYMEHLCAEYLPYTSAVTTVSQGLADLYGERYGTFAEVVRNSPDFQDIEPSSVDAERIRLVHSGIADAERNILGLIEAVDGLGERFTLDLYLLEVPGGYIDVIRKKAAGNPRITLHNPVPPDTLPVILNEYDLGVFMYPIRTLSHLHHLPNKFFDFVQARLGLVFSPAPEVDAYIKRYGLGIVTKDASTEALVDALRDLTVDQIRGFKQSAHEAARALSNEPDRAVLQKLVANLLV
jgi:glycosyltransferase involved in cell wall biosynthesis